MRDQATEIVDRVAPLGECDFVTRDRGGAAVADHLRHDGHPARPTPSCIFELTNVILGVGDPEYVQSMEDLMAAGMEPVPIRPRARRGPARRTRATTSRPRSCTPRSRTRTASTASAASELGSFFLLLVVAGNETTRNAISHGMLALTAPPRSAQDLDRRLRRRLPHRGRGDRAVGHAGDPLPPHRDARHRGRRAGDQGRREGRDVLQLGEPRRAAVRRPVPLRRHAARPTSTSASAPAARTSASARTSPGARSG